MAISQSESTMLTCPACSAQFVADVWILIDAVERPALAQALRDGALNVVVCPRCRHSAPAGTPLLFHDPLGRRVYFAAPPDAREHAWRERAQELIYALVDAIPTDAHRPYLGDVQVEQEVEGVRRAVLRHDRRRGGNQSQGRAGLRSPAAPHEDAGAPPLATPAEPLLESVRALLAANSAAEFAAIVAAAPALLSDAGDAAAGHLIALAYAQREHDAVAALREVRASLARMRAGQPIGTGPPRLPAAAYQALLRAASRDALIAAARDYPALLEHWADAELSARAEAALDEGNQRLAGAIESRREALVALRAPITIRAGREAS